MKKKNKEHKIILGTTVGVAIGSALGVTLNNIALGMSTGIAIGAAIGLTMDTNKSK